MGARWGWVASREADGGAQGGVVWGARVEAGWRAVQGVGSLGASADVGVLALGTHSAANVAAGLPAGWTLGAALTCSPRWAFLPPLQAMGMMGIGMNGLIGGHPMLGGMMGGDISQMGLVGMPGARAGGGCCARCERWGFEKSRGVGGWCAGACGCTCCPGHKPQGIPAALPCARPCCTPFPADAAYSSARTASPPSPFTPHQAWARWAGRPAAWRSRWGCRTARWTACTTTWTAAPGTACWRAWTVRGAWGGVGAPVGVLIACWRRGRCVGRGWVEGCGWVGACAEVRCPRRRGQAGWASRVLIAPLPHISLWHITPNAAHTHCSWPPAAPTCCAAGVSLNSSLGLAEGLHPSSLGGMPAAAMNGGGMGGLPGEPGRRRLSVGGGQRAGRTLPGAVHAAGALPC